MSFDDYILVYSCVGRLIVWVSVVPVAVISVLHLIKKDWKRTARIWAVFCIGTLALWAGEILLYRIDHGIYLSQIFDTKVKFGPPIYEYDSPRAFNGDGYSISVYQLPDSIRDRFSAFDEKLKSEFPKRSAYRKHWHTQNWKVGPISKDERKYMRFACEFFYDGAAPRKLKQNVGEFRRALRSDPVYFSFLYSRLSKGKQDYYGDIDFFMINPETGRVYLINHNT